MVALERSLKGKRRRIRKLAMKLHECSRNVVRRQILSLSQSLQCIPNSSDPTQVASVWHARNLNGRFGILQIFLVSRLLWKCDLSCWLFWCRLTLSRIKKVHTTYTARFTEPATTPSRCLKTLCQRYMCITSKKGTSILDFAMTTSKY